MYDVMIGKKYDIQDLRASGNIWELLEQNASSLRMFNYRSPSKGGRELVTCKVGITKLGSFFSSEVSLLSKKFSDIANVASENKASLGAGIVNALELSSQFYGNLSGTSGADQLKQVLIINAFKNVPARYGHTRAVQEQNTTWKFLGEMSQMTLPILHAIFQALLYGAFPIVILLAFFSRHLRILGTYFEMLLWLEIWPLLFAILNLIVSVFARHSYSRADISIESIDHIVSIQGSYALAASSMGMLVPVLSYMILKTGASSFVHIAGQVMGATQAGASTASHEAITGNRSLDHISTGDRSFNNVHGNKTNIAGDYTSGYMRQTLSDGRLQTDFLNQPSGSDRIYQGGAGITSSTGNFSTHTSQMQQDNINKSIQHEESVVAAEGHALSESRQNSTRANREFMDTISANHLVGNNVDVGSNLKSAEISNMISREAHSLGEDYNYKNSQSSAHTLDGGVGINAGANVTVGSSSGGGGGSGSGLFWLPKLSGNLTGGLSGNVGYKYTGTSSSEDSQNIKEDQVVSTNMENTDFDERAVNLAKNMHFSDSQVKEKRLAENVLQADEEYQQKLESYNVHKNKLESMRELRDQLSSVGVRGEENSYGKFLNYVATRPDTRFDHAQIGEKRALQIVEHGGAERDKYFREFTSLNMPQQMWRNNRSLDESYRNSSHALEREQMQKINSKNVDVNLGNSKEYLSSQANALKNTHVDTSEGYKQYEAKAHEIDQRVNSRRDAFESSSEVLRGKVDAKEDEKRDNLINKAPFFKNKEKQNPYFKKDIKDEE